MIKATIIKPIVGYSYGLSWELPDSDEYEYKWDDPHVASLRGRIWHSASTPEARAELEGILREI
ncbi:MAG: hypothetical protein AAB393_16945, partial [Bacteroidota bacterium]